MPSNQIKITDFTSEALGVGRLASGQVAMIRGAVPGDTITAKLDSSSRKGVAFGEIDTIVEPSPHRTDHPCPHYSEGCAGCLLGVYDYSAELEWKTDHLKQSLRRIGKIEAPDVREIIPSPNQWNYRDRLEMHLELKNGQFQIGYVNSDGFFSIRDCHLGVKSIRDSIVQIQASLPNLSTDLKDSSYRLLIRDNGNESSVAVIFTELKSPEQVEVLKKILESGNFAGWEIQYVSDFDLRYFSAKTIDRAGKPMIRVDVGDKTLFLPVNSFTQTNRKNSSVLRKKVVDIVPPKSSLLDMYGGYGAFAMEYVIKDEKGKAQVAESSKTMVFAGKKFANRAKLAVSFKRVNLRKLTKMDYPDKNYDCVIVDPPRAGIHGSIIQYLNDQGPEQIIYVSCRVAALARDIQKLNLYTPEYFQPLDMFPNTPEIETIAVLRRRDKLD